MFKLRKFLLNTLGIFALVCGIIGLFLPLWPTTPFVLLASFCFVKAKNPKLNAWLLKSKTLGPYLQKKHGISMAYKMRTCMFMWSSLIFTIVLIDILWVQALLVVMGSGVSMHIFSIKTAQNFFEQPYTFKYNLTTILLCWMWIVPAITIANNTTVVVVLLTIGIGIFTLPTLIYAIVSKKSAEKIIDNNITDWRF